MGADPLHGGGAVRGRIGEKAEYRFLSFIAHAVDATGTTEVRRRGDNSRLRFCL